MRSHILYAVIGGFALGIFFASLYPTLVRDIWLLLLLGVTLLIVWRREEGANHAPHVLLGGVCLLAIAVGLWRTELYRSGLESGEVQVLGETFTFVGVISREPEQRTTTTHLYVTSSSTTFLVYADRYQSVSYGDEVQVTGTVEKPEPFETDLSRTFNYPGYLAARGVTLVVYRPEVELLARGTGNQLITSLLSLKEEFLQRIEQQLPEPQAGLAEGLLLGVKRALGEELETVFRTTGIIHIVVLSGYNIMLVVAFVLYMLSFVLPWRGRLIVGLLAIVAFALMVGLSATVVRASIMAALALVARTFGRTYSVLRGLFIAGLIMLLINPYLLVFDTGFQLSFMATLGLILVAPHLEKPFERVPAIIGVREFLIATLATQLFVLPILLYQIGEFSVVSVFVNVLVLPMVPVAMLLTFLVVVASVVSSTLATLFSYVAYAALSYIIIVPTWFAALPFASFMVPAFPFVFVLVAYALIAFAGYRFTRVSDPLAGWTIEDAAEVSHKETPARESETPVFFR